MNRIALIASLLAGCAGGTYGVGIASAHPTTVVSARYDGAAGVIGVELYQELDAYGTWTTHPTYGEVFVPARGAYAPYTLGRWVRADAGLTYVSDVPFERITCHYGRWTYDSGHWMWIPDTVWAPAWVEWRAYGDYVGWAPLGPGDVAISASWRFVDDDALHSHDLRRRYVSTTAARRFAPHARRYDPYVGRRGGWSRHDVQLDRRREAHERAHDRAERRVETRERAWEQAQRQREAAERAPEVRQRAYEDAERAAEDRQRAREDAERAWEADLRRREAAGYAPTEHERRIRREQQARRRADQAQRRYQQDLRREDQGARRYDQDLRRRDQEQRRYQQELRREDQDRRRHQQELRRRDQAERRHDQARRRGVRVYDHR